MRKRLCVTTIFMLILMFTTLHAGAYTISGHISFSSVTNVIVTLSGDASMVTMTDANGYYEFTNLEEGGTYTITPSKAYTPPRVRITNPESNDPVIGNITISTDIQTDYCGYAFNPPDLTVSSLASDQHNQDFQVMITDCCFMISGVEFYIDNILEQTDTTFGMCWQTYVYAWDTTGVSDGPHIIKVVAIDEHSGQGSAEIPVTVNNNTMALIGDVNLDNNVTIVDALLTAQYYVNVVPSVYDTPLGDVNVDNTINIVDALLIAQYYVGLITELPRTMPGGYGRIPVSIEHALIAYHFLADDLATTEPEITLGVLKLAFSQVVAGFNVRLVCSYYSSATKKDHFLTAVIYFNLEGIPQQVSSLNLDMY